MITIESKPFATTMYYSGIYTADISLWEDEYQEGRYEFTLIYFIQDSLEDDVSITWLHDDINGISNVNEIEQKIITQFLLTKLMIQITK